MRKFLYLHLILLVLISCSKEKVVENNQIEYIKIPQSNPTLVQKGGVDGSGGNITKISYQEFKDIIADKLPPMVDELIKRSIVYFSYKDQTRYELSAVFDEISYENNVHKIINPFEHIPDLIKDFLSEDTEFFTSFLKQVKYRAEKDACVSNNHANHHTDAAINDKTEICLSYKSFKNFQGTELYRNLLVMIMHEVSHAKGYNERDASLIQEFFNSHHFGKNLIIIGNYKFQNYYHYLRQTIERLDNYLSLINFGDFEQFCQMEGVLSTIERYIEVDDSFSTFVPYAMQELYKDSFIGACHRGINYKDTPYFYYDKLEIIEETSKFLAGLNKKLEKIYAFLFPNLWNKNYFHTANIPTVNNEYLKKLEQFERLGFMPTRDSYLKSPYKDMEHPNCIIRDTKGNIYHGEEIEEFSFFRDNTKIFDIEIGINKNLNIRLYTSRNYGYYIHLDVLKENSFSIKEDINRHRFEYKEGLEISEINENYTFYMNPELTPKREITIIPYLNEATFSDNSKRFDPFKNTITSMPIAAPELKLICEYEQRYEREDQRVDSE